MSEIYQVAVEESIPPKQFYRAITRHSDGRIIHVRDIRASNDAEAVQIATERGADIRTDLYGEDGLVQRFGVSNVEPVTPGHWAIPD